MLRCFSVRRASSVFSTVHRAHASRVAGSLSCRAFTSQSSNGGRQQQQQQQQLFTLFGAATAATALALSTAALGAAGPLLDSVSGVSVDSVSYCDAQDAASADTFVQTPAPTTNAHATSPHPPHPPHLPPSPPATRSPPKKPMSRRKLARRNSMRKQKRHYQYVIVGAGTTTYAAIEAIRAVDTDADILIISDQSKLPRIDIDSSEEDQLLECDALADTYNEWRRHVNSRLENEPDAYSTSAVRLSFSFFSVGQVVSCIFLNILTLFFPLLSRAHTRTQHHHHYTTTTTTNNNNNNNNHHPQHTHAHASSPNTNSSPSSSASPASTSTSRTDPSP
jgi:hypothetical protein